MLNRLTAHGSRLTARRLGVCLPRAALPDPDRSPRYSASALIGRPVPGRTARSSWLAIGTATLLLLSCRWALAEPSSSITQLGTLSEPQRAAADEHQRAQRQAVQTYVECLKSRYGEDRTSSASAAASACAEERAAYASLLPEDLRTSILEGIDAAVHRESAK
jgi:hypothetical protein